jgi:hypothetical protein
MIQDNLLKSNFLGRDGFRWWVGQVAPSEAQGKQGNGGGWGNRYKVRIMGYHPFNATELPDKDLPWCQCILPATDGSGAANMASNTKLRPGDVVFGFFLDGDNAQIPAIIGCFGRTDQVLTTEANGPFVPFTGYNDKVKKPNGTLAPKESNQQNVDSAKSPRSVSKKVSKSLGNNEISYSSMIGQSTVFANTCGGSSHESMSVEINNLLDKVQNGASAFLNITHEINQAVDKIQGLAEEFIGQMFNNLFTKLTPILQKGLELLYKQVYATVLAATLNPAAAYAAGVAAQVAMTKPVNVLEKAIPCAAANVAKGLGKVIKDLISSAIENIKNFVSCAGDQFVGALLNQVISKIVSELSSAIGGVAKILSGGINIANILRDGVDAIKAVGGLFDCNQQSKSKCSSIVTQWTVGKGPKKVNATDFKSIISSMNIAAAAGNIGNSTQQKYGSWDILGSGTGSSANSECYTGKPPSCGPVTVNIFGGFGEGATATPILGINKMHQLPASIIGVKITNGGKNYLYPPFVEFVDNCNQGFGAIGRAVINDAGEVTDIYMVSTGEDYPLTEDTPVAAVDRVVVDSSGTNYRSTDNVKDDFGNQYRIKTDNNGSVLDAQLINTSVPVTDIPIITITSTNGIGAILRPVIGISSTSQQQVGAGGSITSVIDCIT